MTDDEPHRSQRPRVTFSLSSPILVGWVLMLVGVAVGVGVAIAVSGPFKTGNVAAAVVLLLLGLGLAAAPRTVEVGVDGVAFRVAYGARRFVPFARVAEIARSGRRGVRLRYSDGKEELLQTGPELASVDGDDGARDGLFHALQEAWTAWATSESSNHAAARISRQGRTAGEWSLHLQELAAKEPNYRVAHLHENDLWAVLEDGSQAEDARAAAALLLRNADAEACARIRVAADAAVSPRLRVALEAAASETAPEAEELLAPFDETDAVRAKRRGS